MINFMKIITRKKKEAEQWHDMNKEASKEANEFLNKHKQITKGLKKSQYKLVVTPSQFECENDGDIKSVCMGLLLGASINNSAPETIARTIIIFPAI